MPKFLNPICTLILALLCLSSARADCLSGNCDNGQGRYDYGFAIYEGDFVNGQPEGLGVLDDGTTKYVGEFKKGLQNGRGTVYYRDGRAENARFVNGQKQATFTQKIDAALFDKYAAAILQDRREEFKNEAACAGNCNTGIGTYTYPSGNVYSGEWKNRKRNGFGKAKFANGNTYEGQWVDDLQNGQGTWTKPDGWKYVGVFRNGDPFEGQYTAPNGGVVTQRNGEVQMPPAPKMGLPGYINGYPIDMRPRPQTTRCEACGGRGQLYSVSRKTTVTPWRARDYGPGSVGGYNPNDAYSYHTSVSYDTVATNCSKCGGEGRVAVK